MRLSGMWRPHHLPKSAAKVLLLCEPCKSLFWKLHQKGGIFQQLTLIREFFPPQPPQTFSKERNLAFLHLADVVASGREVFSPSLLLELKTGLRVGAIGRQIRGLPERLALLTKELLLVSDSNVLTELTPAAMQLVILIHTHLRLERYDTFSLGS